MKRYVARFTLITLIGVSLVFTVSLAKSSAKGQQPDRIVVRKPWPVEPVRIVAVKTKNKENIEIGEGFDEDDDWLDGFTVTVANNYDKTVTAMEIEMVFRREPGDTRPPLAYSLHFGPSPDIREYLNRDPNKVIKVGKTADLHISPENYRSLKRYLEQTGYPSSIRRVELVIREVGFEDGSMLHTGTFYLQDPANPNDPTKKVPVREPPDAKNQKNRTCSYSVVSECLSYQSSMAERASCLEAQREGCHRRRADSERIAVGASGDHRAIRVVVSESGYSRWESAQYAEESHPHVPLPRCYTRRDKPRKKEANS